MKKILALLLAVAMLFALCACGNNDDQKKDNNDKVEDKPTTSTTEAAGTTTTVPNNDEDNNNEDNGDTNTAAVVKFGSAVYVSGLAATDATEDKTGQGSADITAAAVTLDADGKIVACDLDTMQNKVAYSFDGKAVANTEFKTKYEQGDAYNMVAYGGAKQEWYKQVDAFETLIVGKTIDEVKALVIEGKKGTDEVVNAGCTIMIEDFVKAIEKAAANANADVSSDVTVKVTLNTTQTCTDATEDKAGSNKIETYTFAAAMKDGKVVSADSDCVEISFGFDETGKTSFDAAAAVQSKREKGDAYGMVAYGGAKLEWYQQADAFDATCEGKTGAEIAGLIAEDGKGVEAVQTAGCTIYVSGFVAAASKI